ncbi:hypothetical protein CFE53_02000 [Methanofervidicoccus sp. A16]|nr:hypothetical protein CFE53_02000 [Methanofervidicoccus sp. A16]
MLHFNLIIKLKHKNIMMEKINELSKKLDALMKVAAISSATKISEDIKKEISKLEEEKEEIKEEETKKGEEVKEERG